MRVLRACRVGVCAGLLLVAGWALAGDPAIDFPMCTRTPTDADIEGAKGAHNAATQFYERADYDRAIQYWRDAYEFDCTAHGVLINIANAYEKKGDKQRTIAVLEAYLTRAPGSPNASTIQDKIQNLKSSLKPPPPKPTATASAPPPLPTATAAPTSSASAPPPEGPRPYGYQPWYLVGGGGVVAVVGAILMPVGLSAVASAEEDCPSHGQSEPCPQEIADKGNSGRTMATIGGVALGLGIAGAAGGLIWQFALNEPVAPATDPAAAPSAEQAAKRRRFARARVRVAPAAGPDYGGVSITGRF